MRILVTGGKGGLGRDVVRRLRALGHEVLVGTRKLSGDDEVGFDLAGTVPGLSGLDTVVHLASQVGDGTREVNGSKALFDEARQAGVGHVVFMSIVGIDTHPFPYYRAKAGGEQALVDSGVPWSILRSTQFHDFVPRLADTMSRFGVAMFPSGVSFQPVDRDLVAEHIVELVEAGPSGRVADLGGPEVLDAREMARSYLRATGRHTPVLPMPMGGKSVEAFRQGVHHSPNRDHRGRTYGEWLSTLPRRSDAAAGLLRLSGGLLMMTVVIMLIAPGFFHESWAGFGALNTHFIRDAATFGVPLGVALWMSASRPAWRKPVLALALVQNGLHIANHIADVANSEPRLAWPGQPRSAGGVPDGAVVGVAPRRPPTLGESGIEGGGVNDDWFEAQRPRLMGIAYGMLGSVMEAEDVVQDAWLRWQAVDKTQIHQPAAFLTTITTRLAIDQLRSARRRRETYVGPWLPEPIVREHDDDPADVVAEAERLSMALLTAMERLDAVERAVLLLRETFDLEYAEIADVVDKSPTACRQIAKRARERVGDPSRRRPVDNPEQALAPFLAAITTGDADALMRTLAADVIAWSDGGGIRRAARHPVPGAERVAKFLISIVETGRKRGGSAQFVVANGGPALRIELDGELYAVMTFDIEDGLVTAIRSVLNPDKLGYARRLATDPSDR